MNSILIGTGRVFYSIVIFLLGVFASRYFNINDYGIFREFLLYLMIGIGVSAVPSINAIFYFKKKNLNFAFVLFIISFFSAVFILLILFIIMKKIFILYVICILPASILYMHLETYLISFDKVKRAFLLTILESSFFFSIIFIIYFLKGNINDFYQTVILVSIIRIIIYSIFIYFLLYKEIICEKISNIFKYIFPIFINSYVGIISSKSDKYFVSLFFGPSVFAFYSSGAFEIPLIGRFIGGVFHSNANNVRELNEKNDFESLKLFFIKLLDKIFIPIGILTLLFFINSKSIIEMIYSSRYESSYLFFMIYLFILPARIIPLGFLLNLFGKTKQLMILGIGDAVLTTISVIILILLIGPIGGAFAFVIITFIQILFILYFLRINFPVKYYLYQYFILVFIMNIVLLFINKNGFNYLYNIFILLYIMISLIIIKKGKIWKLYS